MSNELHREQDENGTPLDAIRLQYIDESFNTTNNYYEPVREHYELSVDRLSIRKVIFLF